MTFWQEVMQAVTSSVISTLAVTVVVHRVHKKRHAQLVDMIGSLQNEAIKSNPLSPVAKQELEAVHLPEVG